jgi:hypothetical protein
MSSKCLTEPVLRSKTNLKDEARLWHDGTGTGLDWTTGLGFCWAICEYAVRKDACTATVSTNLVRIYYLLRDTHS